jgi:hypothetical protein
MHNRGLTLLEVVVILVVIGIVVALFLPMFCGTRHPRTVACQSNLQQLYKLCTVYAVSHRGEWPAATEENLWLSLRTTKPPLIETDHAGILHCDVLEHELGPDETNYRGPRRSFSKLGAGELLCADREDNHGEGQPINVMHKDGSVLEAAPGDALWKKCREALSP